MAIITVGASGADVVADDTPTTASGQVSQSISVRATPLIADPIIKYIANVGVPMPKSLRRGQSIRAQMKQDCGYTDNAYFEILRKLPENRSLKFDTDGSTLVADATVAFPACLVYHSWDNPAEFPCVSLESDGISGVMQRYIGYIGEKTRKKIQQATHAAPCPSANGPQVRIPSAAGTARIKIRPESGKTADEVFADLNQLEDDAAKRWAEKGKKVLPSQVLPAKEVDQHLEIIEKASDALSDIAESCVVPETVKDWPIDMAEIQRAISRNSDYLRENRNRAWQKTDILVVDSGVQNKEFAGFNTDIFDNQNNLHPIQVMWHNDVIGIAPSFGSSHQGIDIGNNPVVLKSIVRLHGEQTAALAIGGRFVATGHDPWRDTFVKQLLGIKLAVIFPAGDVEDHADADSFVKAIRYAHETSIIKVVNASVKAGEDSDRQVNEELDSGWLPDFGGFLIVAAAGNDGADLDNANVHLVPAKFASSPHGNQVLAVAAHDPSYQLLDFSNRGRNTVEIAAPGCGISPQAGDANHYTIDEQDYLSAGTSFAAPIVSFAAALAASQGMLTLSGKPYDLLKARLIASAKFEDTLDPYVRFGAALDIPAAVSLPFDQIEWRDGTKQYGKIQTSLDTLLVCYPVNDFNQVSQIRLGDVWRIGDYRHIRSSTDNPDETVIKPREKLVLYQPNTGPPLQYAECKPDGLGTAPLRFSAWNETTKSFDPPIEKTFGDTANIIPRPPGWTF